MNCRIRFIIVIMFIFEVKPTLVLPLMMMKSVLQGGQRIFGGTGQQTEPLADSGYLLNSGFKRNSGENRVKNSEISSTSDFQRDLKDYQLNSWHSSNFEFQKNGNQYHGNSEYLSDAQFQREPKNFPMTIDLPPMSTFRRNSKELGVNLDHSFSLGMERNSNKYPVRSESYTNALPSAIPQFQRNTGSLRSYDYQSKSTVPPENSGYASKSKFSFSIGRPKNNDDTQRNLCLLERLGISLSFDRESSLKLG